MSLPSKVETPDTEATMGELPDTSGRPSSEQDTVNLIAKDMKTLVQKIQGLRHLGIENSEIALPKICVVGDQSRGKSSLIEGMSEIKVPRSSGTCTRCPMEINLSESGTNVPWTCKVWLSRDYNFGPNIKMPTPKRKLGPWIEQDREDEHFMTLTDKAQVQETLKWAQRAILNPHRSSKDYIPGSNVDTDPTSAKVKFSPNIVRLDISAPGFPNLSFYDLPGVISLTEFENENYLVPLVEKLAKTYITQENCIVLLAQTMTDDATNSRTARIIRDAGAKMRTVGVLTKPDRMQTGESYDQWREILEGRKFSLGHGYYVVKNNPDASVEHAQARGEETAFFASEPWSTELSDYSGRFGTRCLQTALSCLLLDQIQGCLPRVITQIDEKAAKIDRELQTLPNPPCENVQYILSAKLHELKDEIRSHIDGGSTKHSLLKNWNRIAHDFKRSLSRTRPSVTILAKSDKVPPKFQYGDDSDCEVIAVQIPMKRKTPADEEAPAPPPKIKKEKPKCWPDHFGEFVQAAKKFTWEEIRDIKESSYRSGLPDQADPKAVETMNQMSVEHWNGPMEAFLNATYEEVRETFLRSLESVFVQYHQTGLYRELVKIVTKYLRGVQDEHFEQATEIFMTEYNKPFTMATRTLENANNQALESLTKNRHRARANWYLDQNKNASDDMRRENEIKKLGEKELGLDPFTQEVKMMATNRGYYDVASARFIDSVCQSVHTKLFAQCRDKLINVIERELRIFDSNAMERCLELMAEDEDRFRRRQNLLRERDRLTKAQRWLASAAKEDDVEQ